VNARVISRPLLTVTSDPRQPTLGGVSVYNLDSELMASLGRYTRAGHPVQSIFQVAVIDPGAPITNRRPSVSGRYQILRDGVRFVPHLPFERGLPYRASFDPLPLGHSELSEVETLDFSLPREQSPVPSKVKHVFPSGDHLPENLLRFYVCFSKPVQRGHVQTEISLLGPDGELAPDVLYRAPAELWDRRMQCLTILLDPGRIKRGVGPNRRLGPPLKVGQQYTLAIGPGMLDLSGRRLCEPFFKRFRVTEAVRTHIAVEQWRVGLPVTNSHRPLVLTFPRPLDWALLSWSIGIVSTDGQSIAGQVAIDQCERRWSFTPASPWSSGDYHVRIASSLEDVCGNSLIAAFDRSLRPGSDLASEVENRPVSFRLA
jgi:hypothetical protein